MVKAKTVAKKQPSLQATSKLKIQVTKAKETISELKENIKKMKVMHAQEVERLLEEAYVTGYVDAMEDFDKKTMAMEEYLEKAVVQFEKEYAKKSVKPAKKTAKKKTKKPTKKAK